MKLIFGACALLAAVSLATGCVAGGDDDDSDVVVEAQQELSGGGTLTCTNSDPLLVDSYKIVCDAAGKCVFWDTTPAGASTGYPMTVISARSGKVTWSIPALGWKVAMLVSGSTPTSATVFEPSGVAATCQ